jgi:hypothetical protein
VQPSDGGVSLPVAAPDRASTAELRSNSDSSGTAPAAGPPAEQAPATKGAPKIRRLIADQQYFGLDAKTFHNGAAHMLARLTAQGAERPRVDVRTLGEDFHLDGAASWALLRAMLAGGLLLTDGPGNYRPAARFREYALANVVLPLSRARAREVIDRANKLAARINTNWDRNPYRIRMVAVSGSYMSRSDRLQDLSLWLVLNRRAEARTRRWRSPLGKSDALRQIAAAMRELSSFVVVRIVSERHAVQRPFSVVFQAEDDFADSHAHHSWERFREWGASISRRLHMR